MQLLVVRLATPRPEGFLVGIMPEHLSDAHPICCTAIAEDVPLSYRACAVDLLQQCPVKRLLSLSSETQRLGQLLPDFVDLLSRSFRSTVYRYSAHVQLEKRGGRKTWGEIKRVIITVKDLGGKWLPCN